MTRFKDGNNAKWVVFTYSEQRTSNTVNAQPQRHTKHIDSKFCCRLNRHRMCGALSEPIICWKYKSKNKLGLSWQNGDLFFSQSSLKFNPYLYKFWSSLRVRVGFTSKRREFGLKKYEHFGERKNCWKYLGFLSKKTGKFSHPTRLNRVYKRIF